MLGQDLARAAHQAGLEVTPLARADLDITEPGAVDAALELHRPDVIVNCAAWTDVDGAESDPEGAHRVNALGAGNLARSGASRRAHTIQVSSDYVFDGAKRAPYVESDPTGPISAYGASKLAGERAVAEAAPGAHTIVRSSWLFGVDGRCFPKTILRLASEREELTVVDDQVGCPTFTGHLALALVELVVGERIVGVVHVAGGGQCSWFEFASKIVESAGLACQLTPGNTADLDRAAPRPAYSVLRSERRGVPELPDWPDGLDEFMAASVGVS
jgi:dTDP-4-dehydrorhamnose reductase